VPKGKSIPHRKASGVSTKEGFQLLFLEMITPAVALWKYLGRIHEILSPQGVPVHRKVDDSALHFPVRAMSLS
jgi:hypothetical protein